MAIRQHFAEEPKGLREFESCLTTSVTAESLTPSTLKFRVKCIYSQIKLKSKKKDIKDFSLKI
ncbi:MAG: hypothetical protein ACFFB0_04470 [Promethearchaeota archaeon]